MSESKIEWTDRVWNPIRGCARVSAGCENCYAERQAHRFSGPGKPFDGLTRLTSRGPQWAGRVELVPERLDLPLRWRKPARIFVCSMSDPFHEDVPDEFLAQMFAVMSACHGHTFQLLTKRPQRMREWVARIAALAPTVRQRLFESLDPVYDRAACAPEWPLPNVQLGVSVENQAAADERIPELLATPAAVRFLSCEPLIASVDIAMGLETFHVTDPMLNREKPPIDWVIVGGESGPRARPCHIEWIRSIVEQCKAARTACFVKQLGALPMDRNDAGFDGDEPSDWPSGTETEDWTTDPARQYQGAPCVICLRDWKGSDASEWPEDLRVREFPA